MLKNITLNSPLRSDNKPVNVGARSPTLSLSNLSLKPKPFGEGGIKLSLNIKPATERNTLRLAAGGLGSLRSTGGAVSLKAIADQHLSSVKPTGLKLRLNEVGAGSSTTSAKLDLSAALLTKPSLNLKPQMKSETICVASPEPMDTSVTPIKHKKVKVIEKYKENLDPRLVPKTVSALAEILCNVRSTVSHSSTQVDNLSYSQQALICSKCQEKHSQIQTSTKITPFMFDTPSPDDIVLEKQKGAFTRTGESKRDMRLWSFNIAVRLCT